MASIVLREDRVVLVAELAVAQRIVTALLVGKVSFHTTSKRTTSPYGIGCGVLQHHTTGKSGASVYES